MSAFATTGGSPHDVWVSSQLGLPAVTRWSKYVDAGRTRKQDSLQYSYGVAVLRKIFVERMRPYPKLGGELIVTALLLHDHGEGELGRDTLSVDKTDRGDLDEHFAFRKRLGPERLEAFGALHAARLLQFVSRSRDGLPEDARRVVDAPAAAKRWEAQAFDALERWGFLLFAPEQYLERGNEVILTRVLRNRAPKLDRRAREPYGFREVDPMEAEAGTVHEPRPAGPSSRRIRTLRWKNGAAPDRSVLFFFHGLR